MPDFLLAAAEAVPPQRLHAAFTAAFADYLIGPFTLSLQDWPRFLARQGIDVARSRVALRGEEVQAFALAAPRPDRGSWRLGTMGALPSARGSGAAQSLLDDFVARAAQNGCAQVELECFAQNERGLRLYRSRGFEVVCPLQGYRRAPAADVEHADEEGIAAVDLASAWGWLADAGRRMHLPLQVTPPSLRAQSVPLQAWRRGAAQVVAGESAPAQLTLYSLVDLSPEQEDAARLARFLAQRFAGHAMHVPQLQRDDVGGRALQRLGWEQLPLHQILMRKSVRAAHPQGAAAR